MYRQGAFDVDALPWGTIDLSAHDPDLVEQARGTWTENAFNEYCTGAVLGQLVHEMTLAHVPLDLCGIVARFPFQELVHVELCSRMAMELGGGAPLAYDTDDLVLEPPKHNVSPITRCRSYAYGC